MILSISSSFLLVALISVESALFCKIHNTVQYWNYFPKPLKCWKWIQCCQYKWDSNCISFGRLQCFVVLQFFAIAAVQPISLNCKRNRAAQPNLHMKIQYKNLIKLTLQLHINLHFNQVASSAAVAAVLDSFAFCSVFFSVCIWLFGWLPAALLA